ncbi:hypothetical protein VTI74DRAFT_8707 [Chaetomium olivicolor]
MASSRPEMLLEPEQSLDWQQPSRTAAVTEASITTQGGHIHHGLGGSSQLNVENRRYESSRPYRQLEQALNEYIGDHLGISHNPDSWDDLSKKIGQLEKRYKDTKYGLLIFLVA